MFCQGIRAPRWEIDRSIIRQATRAMQAACLLLGLVPAGCAAYPSCMHSYYYAFNNLPLLVLFVIQKKWGEGGTWNPHAPCRGLCLICTCADRTCDWIPAGRLQSLPSFKKGLSWVLWPSTKILIPGQEKARKVAAEACLNKAQPLLPCPLSLLLRRFICSQA